MNPETMTHAELAAAVLAIRKPSRRRCSAGLSRVPRPGIHTLAEAMDFMRQIAESVERLDEFTRRVNGFAVTDAPTEERPNP